MVAPYYDKSLARSTLTTARSDTTSEEAVSRMALLPALRLLECATDSLFEKDILGY
jgi:hypothetical protein